MSRLRVVIVGAGIVGASIAWQLARRGAAVTVVDGADRAGRGVTGRAFGWVNLINGTPSNPPLYALRRRAIDEWQRLRTELPEALASARPGSLVWHGTAAATEALAAAHQAEGADIRLVDREAIRAAEPALLDPPAVAAWSPGDLGVSPAFVAAAMMRAAAAAGATLQWGQAAIGLAGTGSRVTGVQVASGTIAADAVVVAAGPDSGRLVAPLGLDLGLQVSPCVLLRYAAKRCFLGQILCGPGLEIRQAADRSIAVATGYVDDSDEHGPAALGRRMLGAMARRFDDPGTITLESAEVGHRPMFADGLPRLGNDPTLPGLHIAVGHPGVILAPLLGRLAVAELIDGERSPLAPTWGGSPAQ